MEKPFAPDLKGDLAEEGEADSREADGWCGCGSAATYRTEGVDGECDSGDVGDDEG